MNIEMIEPTDPAERAAAIRICRANCFLHPDTGLPVDDDEESRRLWHLVKDDVPPKKWLWMWNHGRAEWKPGYRADGE